MSHCASTSCGSLKRDANLSTGRAKILEIGPYPPPYNGWSTRIHIVKNELEQTGHVCVPLNLGENRSVSSSEYECVRSGWEYLCKLSKYARLGYSFHIHTNGESLKGFLVNLIAYCVSLLSLRRPILTFHAGADQTYFPRHKSWILIPLLKFIFGTAKGIICNDPNVARHIADYGISLQKIFPISAFSIQYLNSSTKVLDDDIESFFQNHVPVVLTYAEFRPEYALESVFQAVGTLALKNRGLGLIVVGATNDGNTIGNLAEAAGLKQQCLHIGAVDHDVFLTILRRVSVYLRSAKTEGISASIREALHFGIPVVANFMDIHPEGVFTYTWGNAGDMAKTVELALSKSGLADESQKSTRPVDLPDTVAEEAALLVRCSLGESVYFSDAPAIQLKE